MAAEQISVMPANLSSKDPAYWDAIAERAREMLARFEEEEKPQKLTFALRWEARTQYKAALSDAVAFGVF